MTWNSETKQNLVRGIVGLLAEKVSLDRGFCI